MLGLAVLGREPRADDDTPATGPNMGPAGLLPWLSIALFVGAAGAPVPSPSSKCVPLPLETADHVASMFYQSTIVVESTLLRKTIPNVAERTSGVTTSSLSAVGDGDDTVLVFRADNIHKGTLVRGVMFTVHYRTSRLRDCGNDQHLKIGKKYIVFADFSAIYKTNSYNNLHSMLTNYNLTLVREPVPLTRRLGRSITKITCKKCATQIMMQGLKKMVVRHGRRLRLQCRVKGISVPTFHWYKDGRRLTNNHRLQIIIRRRTSSLQIRNVQWDDRGEYECRAPTLMGESVSSRANVTVVMAKLRSTTSSRPVTTTIWPSEARPCAIASFCLNGGTCMFLEPLQELACQCPIGYVGYRCEHKNARLALGTLKRAGETRRTGRRVTSRRAGRVDRSRGRQGSDPPAEGAAIGVRQRF